MSEKDEQKSLGVVRDRAGKVELGTYGVRPAPTVANKPAGSGGKGSRPAPSSKGK